MKRMLRIFIFLLLCNIAHGQIWRVETPIMANDPYPPSVLAPIVINDTVYQAQVRLDTLIIEAFSGAGILVATQKLAGQFQHAGFTINGLLLYHQLGHGLVALGAFNNGAQFFIDRIFLDQNLQVLHQRSKTFYHNAVDARFRKATRVTDSSFALAGYQYHSNPIHIYPLAFYFNSEQDTSFLKEYEDQGSATNSLWNAAGDDIWYHAPDSTFFFMCGTFNDYLLRLDADLTLKDEVLFFPNSVSNLSAFRPTTYNYHNNQLVFGGCFEGYPYPEFYRGGLLVYNPASQMVTDSIASPPLRVEEKWYAHHVMANNGTFYLTEVLYFDSPFSTTENRWLEISAFTPTLAHKWQLIFGPVAGYALIGMGTFSDGSLFISNRFYNGNRWILELMRIDTNGNYVGVNEHRLSQSAVFHVGPNPFIDELRIALIGYNGSTVKATLHAISGAELFSSEVEVGKNNPLVVPTTALPKGTYILTVQDQSGNVLYRQKVVKQ